jgi:hypothetical protein
LKDRNSGGPKYGEKEQEDEKGMCNLLSDCGVDHLDFIELQQYNS